MNFETNNKQIEIFYNNAENKIVPVIILNTFGGEGCEVWNECQKLNTNDFILVAISKIDWNNDMTPWECPPLYKGDEYYKGYADKYLDIIANDVIPKVTNIVKNDLNKEIDYFGIAGYSLRGIICYLFRLQNKHF